jgi:hypothetical protein
MGGVGMRELFVIIFTVGILFVVLWPYGRIYSRMGYSPWIALLMIVPVVNLITLWVVAYGTWPAVTPKRGR